MKNLRSYLANGIPSPSHSKRMSHQPKRVRVISERQIRRAKRLLKRGESSTSLNQALVNIARGIKGENHESG